MTGTFDLSGHVSLVTGGNGGIGLGMARGLAEAGARVVIWGSNEERNLAAVEQLREHGDVSSAQVDVGDETAVVTAFETLVAEAGRLDSCFANAGIGAF